MVADPQVQITKDDANAELRSENEPITYYRVVKEKGHEPYPYYILWALVFAAFFCTISGFVISLWGSVNITWKPEYVSPERLRTIQNTTLLADEARPESLLLMLAESGCSLISAARIRSSAPNRSDVNLLDPNSYGKFKIMSCHMNHILNQADSELVDSYLCVKDLQVAAVFLIGILLPLWMLVEYNRGYLDRYYRRFLFSKYYPSPSKNHFLGSSSGEELQGDKHVLDSFALIAESRFWQRLYRPVWSVAGVGDHITTQVRLRVFLSFLALASLGTLSHGILLLVLNSIARSFLQLVIKTIVSFPDVERVTWNYSYSYYIYIASSAVNIILCILMLSYAIKFYVKFPSFSESILAG